MAKTALWSHTHPGIYIEGGDAFFSATNAALTTLRSRPIGKDLIDLLSKRCGIVKAIVTILRAPGTLTQSAEDTAATPGDLSALQRDKTLPGTEIKLPGKGSSSYAAYNPYAAAEYAAMVGIPTPVHIALGHELIHSLHHLSGGLRMDAGTDSVTARFRRLILHEEAHTVGLGPYANTRISENALRKEHNLTLRTYSDTPGDCDGLASLT